MSLVEALNAAGVAYCHWKSNDRLARAIHGDEDLDLLVSREHRSRFECILNANGYKSLRQVGDEPITHYFGLDEASNKLIHLHVYYAIVTGGNLLKNYRLPVESALLGNCGRELTIPIPARETDLAVFVIRKLLEHTSFLEYLFLRRESHLVVGEAKWLALDGTPARAASVVSEMFPNISQAQFLRWCNTFLEHGVSLRCVPSGLALARAVRNYRIKTGVRPALVRCSRLFARILLRLVRQSARRKLSHGGALVAIVGGDATGKSTVSAVLTNLLSGDLRVARSHAGLPPASLLTFIPRMFLPLARRLAPALRTTRVHERTTQVSRPDLPAAFRGFALWIFTLRSLMIAYERSRLLRRLVSLAASGTIVIVDRFPTHLVGAMDSAQLDATALALKPGSLLFRLAETENAMYRAMPPADVVVRLHAPIETAISRNRDRDKPGKEDERYLRRRHAQADRTHYTRGTVVPISTEGDRASTIRSAVAAIWERL